MTSLKPLMVDRYLLLDKLHSIGLSRDALLWFNAYLHGRYHYNAVPNSHSDSKIIEKGVPQGSSLGPLLFFLYIYELPKVSSIWNVPLYADDTVIYIFVSEKKKSCSMLFMTRQNKRISCSLEIKLDNGASLENVDTFK